MSKMIIKMIEKEYEEFIESESLDLLQIMRMCKLKKFVNDDDMASITIDEISLESPGFKKYNGKSNTQSTEIILKSEEFDKKYIFFIKILYICLRVNIELFNIKNNILTFKNNFYLIKSIEKQKKKYMLEHINILKYDYKNIANINNNYEKYVNKYIIKQKILDKIIGYIKKILEHGILKKTDNLLSLLLPYFYKYTEYIEEYNC